MKISLILGSKIDKVINVYIYRCIGIIWEV